MDTQTPATVRRYLSKTNWRLYQLCRPIRYRGRVMMQHYDREHLFGVWAGRRLRTRAMVLFLARYTSRGTVYALAVEGAQARELLKRTRLNYQPTAKVSR